MLINYETDRKLYQIPWINLPWISTSLNKFLPRISPRHKPPFPTNLSLPVLRLFDLGLNCDQDGKVIRSADTFLYGPCALSRPLRPTQRDVGGTAIASCAVVPSWDRCRVYGDLLLICHPLLDLLTSAVLWLEVFPGLGVCVEIATGDRIRRHWDDIRAEYNLLTDAMRRGCIDVVQIDPCALSDPYSEGGDLCCRFRTVAELLEV